MGPCGLGLSFHRSIYMAHVKENGGPLPSQSKSVHRFCIKRPGKIATSDFKVYYFPALRSARPPARVIAMPKGQAH